MEQDFRDQKERNIFSSDVSYLESYTSKLPETLTNRIKLDMLEAEIKEYIYPSYIILTNPQSL